MITSQLRPLSDLVQVRARFCRSVHLRRDFSAPKSGEDATSANSYRITPSAHHLLDTLAGAWERPADRAMTLVGPYGAGKSAFAVYLSGLVSGGLAEQHLLQKRDPALVARLASSKRRLLPIPVVGAREPLGAALLAGLRGAVEGTYPKLWSELSVEAVWGEGTPSGNAVVALFERTAQLATGHGFAGVLLLADEVGKFLEHAALHPREGDIFVLQELAEAAVRSNAPLFVLSILHQNADAYAHKLGRAHQAEWAKVGERFREVPFFPSDSERMDMVGFALAPSPELETLLPEGLTYLAQRCAESLPNALAARFSDMARGAYPLHPLVLLALPALFRKAGQSHRSLFNFLSGEEAHALGRYLRETSFAPDMPPLFAPDALFDYTAETLLGGWSAGTLARLWAEAVEAVDRALSLSDDARRTLKVIALLGLLRDPHLPASERVLALALSDAVSEWKQVEARVEKALHELRERKIIVWSRTRGLYRLWEGGDVDVEAALDTARDGLQGAVALRVVTERDICPLPRGIARRHSHETGTLRSVETRACTPNDLPRSLQNRRDLLVVLCLCETVEDEERAEALAKSHDGPNLLIGVARESDALREAARDVVACAEVALNTPALQGDKAARRELDARRFEAEGAFRDEWNRLFGPVASTALWFHQGQSIEFGASRDYSAFLSRLADATFSQTPILRNELVNRHSLSSAAAAGRRILIEAMLEKGSLSRLAIEGHPPELSMYECLLRAPGLHHEVEPGRWEFGPPPENDPARLSAVWSVIEAAIFVEPPAPRPLTELWTLLSAPPYGLTQGVMPPLLLAFLLSHAHETTLYREGTFLAEPKPADWELLLRRPELFAVAGCRIEGERERIVSRLAKGLGVAPYAVPLASALVRNMKRLPDYARQTNHLPEATRALRRALESVSSPEKLLFSDLPTALGVSGLFGNERGEVDVEEFFLALNNALKAWQSAMPDLLVRSRDLLLEACGLPQYGEGWLQLREAAAGLQGRTSQTRLLAFIDRLTSGEDDTKSLDSVLALVANRPPRSWTDADEERFPSQARSWGEMFRRERERSAQSAEPAESFAFGFDSPSNGHQTPKSINGNGNGTHNGSNGNGSMTENYSAATSATLSTYLEVDVADSEVEHLSREFSAALSAVRALAHKSHAPRHVRLAALRMAVLELEDELENQQ